MVMVINLYSAFSIDIFKCALQALSNLWVDETSAYAVAVGSRYQSISDLTQHMNETNEMRPDHNTRNYMPYSLRHVCGFFYVPQGCGNSEELWDGAYGF